MPSNFERRQTETADELQKRDISIRWFEFIDVVSWLERKLLFKSGDIDIAFTKFIDKFRSFWWPTHFYVSNKDSEKVEKYFGDLDKNLFRYTNEKTLKHMREGVEIAKEYSKQCYVKGMFLKEKIYADEGMDDE